MPFTKVTAAGIDSSANFIAQNLSVTGVITASNGIQGIGIQSGRLNVTTGIITALNFIGAGNTIVYNSSTKTVDISIGSGNWAFLDDLNTNTSNIYRLNGNVGIGTTNASSTFTVRGNSLITGVSTFQGISTFQSNVNIAGTVAIGTAINIIPYNNLNSGTLSFEGSAGQLFSITNNLTSGSIFSVNDVSGIPSIDVDVNGFVELAPFNGTVGIATTNPSSAYKLDVAGNTRFSSDVAIAGKVGIATTNPLGPLQIGSAVGSASTQTFVVSGIGSVGIGTTAPFSALDVYGTVYTNRVSIGNSARLSSGLSGAVQRNNQLYIWEQTDANTTAHFPIVIERNTPALDNVKSLIQFSTQNVGGYYSQAYFGVLSTPASDGDLGRGATFIWEHRNTGETMRLTRAGNLGIGSTQPARKLDVVQSTGGTDTLNLQNSSSNNVIRLQAASTFDNYIDFYSGASSGALIFRRGGTETARFNSTGAFVLAGGTTTANGIGIAFPATQSASTDANTLDDYEEGTFTPTIIGSSTAGTGTYSNQIGRYTKIGNRVHFTIYFVWSAHTGTGNMRVSGLPFSSNGTVNNYNGISVYHSGVAMTAGNTMQAYVGWGVTIIDVQQVPTGGGTSVGVPIDSAGEIMLTGAYET